MKLNKTVLYMIFLIIIMGCLPDEPGSKSKFDLKNRTVAVLSFTNLNNDPELDSYSKLISETLSSYLGKKAGIIPVERSNVEKLLLEMKFSMSDLVDQKTAQQVGKLLGAQIVVIGSFHKNGDKIRLNARFVEVETGIIGDTAGKTGSIKKIYKLIKSLSLDLCR